MSLMMSARSTERAERAGKGCSGADIPCGRGQGAPVLGVCPGARARPLGAGGSWRNSTIYLQHERREDEVVSRAVWLSPSAALGIPPWSSRLCCPGSHRDTPDRDTPDLQSLLQPTGDAWGLLQAQGRSCGTREEKGSRLGAQLRSGSVSPRWALPLHSMHGHEDTHPGVPTGLGPSPPFPIAGSDRLQPLGRQRSREGVGPTAPRGRKPAQPQLCCSWELSPAQPIPPPNPAQNPTGWTPMCSERQK